MVRGARGDRSSVLPAPGPAGGRTCQGSMARLEMWGRQPCRPPLTGRNRNCYINFTGARLEQKQGVGASGGFRILQSIQ